MSLFSLQGIENRPNLSALSAIRSGEGAALPIPSSTSTTGPGKTFGQYLMDAIAEVNEAQSRAADLSTRFAAGEKLDVHQVMIAAQEASVMLNLAMQVRNKLVEGYQEITRISM
jgi:flagellar hook-basal body complex protein FliE